jgi:hypothetical protein
VKSGCAEVVCIGLVRIERPACSVCSDATGNEIPLQKGRVLYGLHNIVHLLAVFCRAAGQSTALLSDSYTGRAYTGSHRND